MADTSKGSQLLALPPEILTRILKILSSDRITDLIPYLTTCKLFFHHLIPILWTDVSLSHATILGFATGCMYGNLSYQGVRSLAIYLENSFQNRSYEWEDAWACMGRHSVATHEADHRFIISQQDLHHRLEFTRAVLLTRLSNLISFSVVIDNDPKEPWCVCSTDNIPEHRLSSLLTAIPATCERLIVDTGGAESPEEDSITEGIGRLLPNLRTLRLRVGKISRKLFDFAHAPFGMIEASPILRWWNSDANRDTKLHCQMRSGGWENQGEDGICFGPSEDMLAFLNWSKLSKREQQYWEAAYKSDLCEGSTVQVYERMEEIIVNMCLHPLARGTELDHATARSGLPAAAMLAINLQRAYHRGALPALRTCRIISSDFELTDKEIMDQTQHQLPDSELPCWGLSIGGISEIIVHDIVKNQTVVMPFRRVGKWSEGYDEPFREQEFTWSDEKNVAYEVSLKDIEQDLDIDMDSQTIPSVKRTSLPGYHTETYDGILDRIAIRQKRIDAGTADGRYATWWREHIERENDNGDDGQEGD